MALNTYVIFNGNSEEALEFYRGALGGNVEIVRFEGSPAAANVPADWGNKVLHGKLEAPGGVLLFAMDATSDRVKNPGDNFALSYQAEDAAQARDVFAKLSSGGQVTMPLGETFWSPMFGMLLDKFGIRWMVNCPPSLHH